MNNNRPHLFDDAAAAAAACGDFIIDRLSKALDERRRASLAVSGGRTPGLMFDRMRASHLPWDRIDFFFVDERAVPPGDADSNFRLANERFLAPLAFPRDNVHRIEGELAPAEAAARYAQAIRASFGLLDGGIPIFDVIHHGMGPDGHTASLFPGDPLIEDRTGIAAAVHAPKPPPDRVTLLPGVLLVSRASVFLVDGEDKSAALDSVLIGELDPKRFPSQLLARSGKHVDWFLGGLAWPHHKHPA